MAFVETWEPILHVFLIVLLGREVKRASSSFDPLSVPLVTIPSPYDRRLYLQHVCREPGPLSALSRLQAEGPPGTATPGPLLNEGGGEEAQAYPRLLILTSSQ